jgi:hypothetical protein
MEDSPGERLFAAYLRQRRLASQREPWVGTRRPDFLVEHPDLTFAAEVYEPEIHLPPGGGFFDSYPGLRRAFRDRKAAQAKAMREAGVPCVMVLARTNADFPFQPEIVAGSMFGNVGVRWRLNDPDAQPQTIFRGGGRVQPMRNRGVSAVAILESFNPTLYRAEEAVAARLGDAPPWHASMSRGRVLREGGAFVRVTQEIYDHMTATGDYIPDARVAKLTVLHNPYSTHPLGLGVLDGPHDVQWDRATSEAGEVGYGPVTWGPLVIRTPAA